MAEEKKNLLTREGLEKYEEELHYLKVTKREEIAQKLKEARAQGDLSENAEYDAAKDEQRNVEARIEELEKLLKNVEVVDNDGTDDKRVKFGSTVKILDKELKEELVYRIVGASEAMQMLSLLPQYRGTAPLPSAVGQRAAQRFPLVTAMKQPLEPGQPTIVG